MTGDRLGGGENSFPTDAERDAAEQNILDATVSYTEDQLDIVYSSLGKATEYWAVVGRGAFAFRFGPYEAKEIGEIMKQAVDRRLAITFIGVVGREFDWQLAKDLSPKLVLEQDDKTTG